MVNSAGADNRARQPLTKSVVIGVAVELADETGIAGLTMRKLADHLGVEAMSLYHHVANKDAILDGMVDAIFAEIEIPVGSGDWKQAMRHRAFSARDVMLRHRWAIGLVESRVNPGPMTLKHHDAVIGCLRASGFSIALAAHAFSLLDSYVYGFVLQELNLPFSNSEELEVVAEGIMEAMPVEQFPHFTEMIVGHALKPGYSYANEFVFGLDLILDGLDRALADTEP